MSKAGLIVKNDFSKKTLRNKIRDALVQKFNYVVVIGPTEVQTGLLSVRARGSETISMMSIEEFLTLIKKEF